MGKDDVIIGKYCKIRDTWKSWLKMSVFWGVVPCVKFRVFWDVETCRHVEVYRSFRGAYGLHLLGDE
jgi:hypothetical protein